MLTTEPHGRGLREKEKMLVASIFSFSQNVFFPSKHKFKFFSNNYFVICKINALRLVESKFCCLVKNPTEKDLRKIKFRKGESAGKKHFSFFFSTCFPNVFHPFQVSHLALNGSFLLYNCNKLCL